MKNSFIDRVIDARKAKKWTQKDLATVLKVNVKNVQRWELGSSKPSFEAAADLADALDVSLDFLAGRSGDTDKELTQLISLVKSLPKPKQKALLSLLAS